MKSCWHEKRKKRPLFQKLEKQIAAILNKINDEILNEFRKICESVEGPNNYVSMMSLSKQQMSSRPDPTTEGPSTSAHSKYS